MKKMLVWAVTAVMLFISKIVKLRNARKEPRRLKYFLSRLAVLTCATIAFASCGDSKWSKSGQRVAESEKSKNDSITQPELPNMQVRMFTIDSVQSEMPKENKNDLCGESQYPCHTFSVNLVILDSAFNQYKIFISVNKSNAPEDEADGEFNFKRAFYDELINGDLSRLDAKFIPKVQNGDGYTGDLYVEKYFPNTGKKIGNAHLIDEHSDQIFFGTVYMVPSPKNLAKLHAQQRMKQ